MSISSKELIDNLIAGSSASFSSHTIRLMEIIESGQEVMLNDVALNDPDQLSVAIFNYPLIKDDLYKEFAEAAKRISSAKYAYYKKSATFKENFTKLCTETFTKHHQSELNQVEQIKKVRSARRVIRFIGELYLADFFLIANIAHFLEVLSNNIDSKVSEDCLECLISIVLNRVKNEAKLYKHNVHISAINSLIDKYENETSKLKRNYKDLEIIEAVNKTMKNKSFKGTSNRFNKDSSRSETIRQTRKIFETILSGAVDISSCVENAYDVSIVFPDSFENEILQLCVDYFKKSHETYDDNFKVKCLEISKFIGMLYNSEVISSDGVKGTINFLTKYDVTFSEPLLNVVYNEIYDKVVELEDEILKHVIPSDFRKILNGTASEKQIEINKCVGDKEKQVEVQMSVAAATLDLATNSIAENPDNQPTCSNSTPSIANNPNECFEKFKDLLFKLSPTNVAYILRETSQIRFTIGEDTVKELATILIEHCVNKPAIIKFIIRILVKLPETIVPNFNVSLMKKHLKAVISSKIIGCSEKESVTYGQVIKELHAVNYYDRFDVIIVLDNFTDNFNHDRTALTTLLQFINEFKDILISKKLSKNMRQKLSNISQKLSIKINEENDEEIKENIGNAIKILNAEVKKEENEGTSNKKDTYRRSSSEVSINRFENLNESGTSSPIQLPPMNIPPPKMFIPPPNFDRITGTFTSSSGSTNNSPIHEARKKSSMTKEKHQLNLKSSVDDDFSNQQTGSLSSFSISMHENDLESDEFYDTASDINAESSASDSKNDFEAESAYSSLMLEDYFNKEEAFKFIIRNQFTNPEAIDNFTVTFIKRGMKCKNRGFIHLIDTIRDALKNQEEIFKNFIFKLEGKFFEFIQNLPKSDELMSLKEKKKSLYLILMTGEFYNMGYMKNQTFIACMEKLLNDIGSEHQITLFHQLIKISMDQIIKNGIANICKTFLDVLAKRVPSIVDPQDRNLISWELFVTIKVLLYRYQVTQLQCPVSFFKLFLSNLNEENFISKLDIIKHQYVFKQDQLKEIVELFLVTAISNYQSLIYVKLADELQALTAIDCNDFTFKEHMEFKLHDVIKNLLTDIHNEWDMIELFKITSLVGDLFAGNVASIYLVLCILEMLLEKEIDSKRIVDCIKVLLRKVGYKIDMDSVLILDKFFLFFNQVVKCETGYRKIIYKDLIQLRIKTWNRTENEMYMEQIEEYFGKLMDQNCVHMSFLICGIISKSFELTEMFLKLLWKFILINPESILLYAKLTASISNYHCGFKKPFMDFMLQRNKTFRRICQETALPNDVCNKLSAVIKYMGYLYVFEFCEDDDIASWIIPIFTKHLSIEQSNELNLIIGKKINESKNSELLRGFMALIEFHSRENLFTVIESVKACFSELISIKN